MRAPVCQRTRRRAGKVLARIVFEANGRSLSPARSWRADARITVVTREGVRASVNVLVTGATGFTGGHLARHLSGGGDRVRALVRPKSRARFDASPLPSAGVIAADGDLLDKPALSRAVE